jgi:hypothetical protein
LKVNDQKVELTSQQPPFSRVRIPEFPCFDTLKLDVTTAMLKREKGYTSDGKRQTSNRGLQSVVNDKTLVLKVSIHDQPGEELVLGDFW